MARSNILKTTLHYLSPLPLYQTTKPYHINVPPTALGMGQQSNEVSRPYHDISVADLRGRERDFSLDQSGFAIFNDREMEREGQKLEQEDSNISTREKQLEGETPSTCLRYEEYDDQERIRSVYRPAVEKWLRRLLGAEEVAVFTHDIRRRAPEFPDLPRGRRGLPQPVQGVHGDFTSNWALERMKMHFGMQKTSEIVKRRWQVLNIWRPLFGPLNDWPLAVCDFRSVDPDADLVASDNVYPHMVSETYNVFYRPTHRWYHLSKMQPHEILVLKSFDSHPDSSQGRAFMCPHAAFQAYNNPKAVRPRESIECIAFVSYLG